MNAPLRALICRCGRPITGGLDLSRHLAEMARERQAIEEERAKLRERTAVLQAHERELLIVAAELETRWAGAGELKALP